MTSLVAPDRALPLDPALPELAAVLSRAGRVRHVDWRPGRVCTVVTELRRGGTTELAAHEVTRAGVAVHRMTEDTGLPGLATALDPTPMTQRLAEVCGTPVRLGAMTPVSWRPGVRAVVAYEVGAATGPARFYAKLLAEGPERSAADAAAITAAARARGEAPPVPEVVALWPDLGAVVQRAAAGRTLSRLLRDESVPERERLRSAELLGRLLATVAVTGTTGRRFGTPDELDALEQLLPPACHADPAAGRALCAVLDRLADTAPSDVATVLSHGAFRAGQVVADRGSLRLLDLDTVSASDAARDAGNALAYLVWDDVRGAVRPGFADALQEAFLRGYADGGTPPADAALAWWTASAMAKIAGRRFRGLATAEWRWVPELLRRATGRLSPIRVRPSAPADVPDADRIVAILQEAGAAGPGQRARITGARTLAEAPGRRRVVRYDVEGLEADGPVAVVAKTYADRSHASLAHLNARLLRDEVFAATPRLTVPEAVRSVPALRMTLYREVPGVPVDRLPEASAVAAARLAGGWLAALHSSGTVLPRRLDVGHEVADVEKWASVVAEVAPGAAAAAYALAGRLAATADELPPVAEVPIHKDFHAGHVLALGSPPDRVAVIDLDEARMGDPVLDLAHVTAYLDASPWRGARAARDALLAAYGPLPGPAPALRWAFFTAHTCMKMAKQLATGRGPLPALGGPDPAPALVAVIRKGAACLDG